MMEATRAKTPEQKLMVIVAALVLGVLWFTGVLDADPSASEEAQTVGPATGVIASPAARAHPAPVRLDATARQIAAAHSSLVDADPGAALALVDAALLADPRRAEAHCIRGLALGELGRLQEALDALDQATALDPDHGAYHAEQGVELYSPDRCGTVLWHLDRAIALLPPNGDLHLKRALCFHELGEADRSVDDAERACELGHAMACEMLGRE